MRPIPLVDDGIPLLKRFVVRRRDSSTVVRGGDSGAGGEQGDCEGEVSRKRGRRDCVADVCLRSLSAMRKDVTAGLYGGHYERKVRGSHFSLFFHFQHDD